MIPVDQLTNFTKPKTKIAWRSEIQGVMDEANTGLEFLLENLEFLSDKPCSQLPWKLLRGLLRFSLSKLEIQLDAATRSRTHNSLCNVDLPCRISTFQKGLLVHVYLFGRVVAEFRRSLLSSNERAHVMALCEDIRVIKSILVTSPGIKKNEELQLLINHEARYWICMALDATDNLLLGLYFSPALSSELAFFRDYFNSFRTQLSRINFSSDPCHCPIQIVIERSSLRDTPNKAMKEGDPLLVGFEKVTDEILDRLFSKDKQREVISIVGMAGIGKTTLAQKLYNDQSVACHFSFLAWTTVSQAFQRKNVLRDILEYAAIEDNVTLGTMDEGDLADKLRKHLYGKKYLIVIDDVWSDSVWDELESCFPDNNNKSRILMTSRIKEVASNANLCSSAAFSLSLLGQVESWALFCHNAFREKRCPPMLEVAGREIVKKCRGLPLAIVVIARVLANKEMTVTSWRQFAESMDAHHDDQQLLDQFMGTLALSYQHLPSHLKVCFLYFGIFPEDYAIPLKRLILSWIAEGYIETVENKSLEDVAMSYLMDLVNRNLVIIAKKRSNGKIKACSVHDMLRDLCIKKLMEEESIRVLHLYEWVHDSSSSNLRHWAGHPFGRTYLFYSHCSCRALHQGSCAPYMSIPFDCGTRLSLYRFLRVLDLNDVIFPNFPTLALQLTHLKYLALFVKRIGMSILPIDCLWKLETFILKHGGETDLILQQGIWKMARLRHLYIFPSFEIETPWISFPNSLVLDDMQTMTTLKCSSLIQDVLATTPNLRKLGVYLNEKNSFSLPDFGSMNHLETLEINWFTTLHNKVPAGILDPGIFPPNMKKLTLTTGFLDWKDMTIIGILPNLEVLKVRFNCFSGPVWETCDGGFCNLKLLELYDLDFKQWISSDSDQFPSLQWLIVIKCRFLSGIPLSFGDSLSLQKISVYHSSYSAEKTAKEIQKLQQEMGVSDQLQLFIGDNLETLGM